MHKRPSTFRLQSAMEYLSTYGWALIILAAVLVAFFYLGLFTPLFLSPKATPGSCFINRPYGPNTTQLIGRNGVCNDLLPAFVWHSRKATAYVVVPGSVSPKSLLNITSNTVTLTAWINVQGYPLHDVIDKECEYGLKLNYNGVPNNALAGCSTGQNNLCVEWDTYNDWTGVSFPTSIGLNKWMFVAVSQAGNSKYWYVNGQLIGNSIVTVPTSYCDRGPYNTIESFTIAGISIGDPTNLGGENNGEWFNGSIANVQVYNSTLSQSDISSLYLEGIGGAPISLHNLVGWWPLNEDEKDYSGDNLNGVSLNASFSETWLTGYTAP